MSQGLKNATGSGMSNIALTEAQKALLTEGDIEGLLGFHADHFGPARMADDDDEDEDDEDDEDESDEDEDDDESDEDEDDEDEESGDDAKGKKKQPKPDPKDERIKEVSAEAKKYRLKLRDSRNRIAELERENARLSRGKAKAKPKDDEEQDDEPQADPEVERKLERAQRALEDAAIRTEFLSSTTFQWKNPKAALRLLDLRDVEVDEDGDVLGLDEAIEKLAKDEPYLLAEKEEARPRNTKRKPTGQPSGKQRKGNPNRDALLSKYPALRR